MPQLILDETQRRILEFLCQYYPYDTNPPQFEQRIVVCGELRLALHEYDEACTGLDRQRLIITDPPYAHDCDTISPTLAARRAVSPPAKPGSLAWKILAYLGQETDPQGERVEFPGETILSALGIPQDEAGWRSYQTACQVLFNWGWITRQEQGAICYAVIGLTPGGLNKLGQAAEE